jgi:glycosyltransferase involved in cell wall biosynthesis
LIEDVNHSPEAYYLNPGMNGLIFKKGDATDMSEKIKILLYDAGKYRIFSENARKTAVSGEASFEKMIEGFVLALEYLHNKRK